MTLEFQCSHFGRPFTHLNGFVYAKLFRIVSLFFKVFDFSDLIFSGHNVQMENAQKFFRVQYISTNADALVTHNPTKAQEHSITPTGPLCPFQSKAGMVPFTPSRFSVLPKSKDMLLHRHGKTVKTWTSMLIIV